MFIRFVYKLMMRVLKLKYGNFPLLLQKCHQEIIFFLYKYAKQKLLPLPQIYWSTGKKKYSFSLVLLSSFPFDGFAFDEWLESTLNEFLVTLKSKHSQLFLSYFFPSHFAKQNSISPCCSLAIYFFYIKRKEWWKKSRKNKTMMIKAENS